MKHIGTKIINATPMTRNDAEALLSRIIGGDKHGDGYLVTYEDGYQSWSPKDVFDRAYRPVSAMTFGDALVMLKAGERVCRSGWNSKGMWLVLINPGNAMHTSSAGAFDMQPCIGMKTANNVMQPGWMASQADMLADDWMLLEG